MLRDTLVTKAIDALSVAKKHLDRSIENLVNRDLKEFYENVWLASSNIEYSAFLLSQMLEDKPALETLKGGSKISDMDDVYAILTDLNGIVEEVLKEIKEDSVTEAYLSVKVAQKKLLKILMFIEKEKFV